MKSNKGFILIRLMVCTAILGVLSGVVTGFFLNNMGATEARAYEGARSFISTNKILIEKGEDRGRLTCAGDSEPRDGYGSCAVVDYRGEKIYLQCPTDWVAINIWKATSCKEIEAALYMRGARG